MSLKCKTFRLDNFISVTACKYLEQGNLSFIIHDNEDLSGQMTKSCNYNYLLEPGNKVTTACVGLYTTWLLYYVCDAWTFDSHTISAQI